MRVYLLPSSPSCSLENFEDFWIYTLLVSGVQTHPNHWSEAILNKSSLFRWFIWTFWVNLRHTNCSGAPVAPRHAAPHHADLIKQNTILSFAIVHGRPINWSIWSIKLINLSVLTKYLLTTYCFGAPVSPRSCGSPSCWPTKLNRILFFHTNAYGRPINEAIWSIKLINLISQIDQFQCTYYYTAPVAPRHAAPRSCWPT